MVGFVQLEEWLGFFQVLRVFVLGWADRFHVPHSKTKLLISLEHPFHPRHFFRCFMDIMDLWGNMQSFCGK